jgi:hypothetical protein
MFSHEQLQNTKQVFRDLTFVVEEGRLLGQNNIVENLRLVKNISYWEVFPRKNYKIK